jgi:hypothetical protein
MRATLKYPESMEFLDRGFARGKCGVECISELCRTRCGLKPGLRTWLALLAFVFSFNIIAAEGHDFVAEAEAAYRAAQAASSTNQTNEAAIAVARTAFDYADLAPNDNIRENIANIGIATARSVIASQTNSVAAHYYLALNIGQLARTKMLGALKLLTEMEHELKIVIQLDPKFDYAGGYRTLGVLYEEAPGWPTSVGSKSKARANLEKALELAPEDPDNHLSYLEALVKWKEWKLATEKLSDYKAILPAAKQKFTGPDWDYEWHDWAKREQAIQTKLQKH